MSKTHEEFCNEIYNKYGEEYTILERYTNCEMPILVRHNCNLCENHEWYITPNNLLRGHTCPTCSYIKRANDNFNKKKEEFNHKFNKIFGNEYELLSEYNGALNEIYVKHNSDLCHNHIWKTRPSDLLNGHRCPICATKLGAAKRRKTQEEFEKEIYDLVGDDYTVLGEYHNSRKNNKILMRHNCNNCDNYTWEANTYNFLNGTRCPICYGNIKKTTEQFKKEVYNLVNEEYEVLGEYKNNKEKVLMRHNCKDCNHYEFLTSPNSFLRGTRCPCCNQSKGEKQIESYLRNNNINYIPQKEYEGLIGLGGGKLSYDFYLPNKNILIEYQGIQHETPIDFKGISEKYAKKQFEKQQKHDEYKRQYAKNHGIKLLEIWYENFDNIENILSKELID